MQETAVAGDRRSHASMRTSTKGILEILAHEAIVTRRYRDSVGVWTVGVGHTVNAGDPDPETMTRDAEVSDLIEVFRRDLKKFEDRVNRAVEIALAQHEFDALVSFDFNTGGVHRASLVKKLNAGDRAGAAAGFMNWRKPKEIIPRRKKEQALFRDGAYSSDGFVSVYSASDSGRVLWSEGKRIDARSLLIAEPQMPKAPPAEVKPAKEPPFGAPGSTPDEQDDPQPKRLSDAFEMRILQRRLRELGYYMVGKPDGDAGDYTKDAVLSFRRVNGLPLSDRVDAQFIATLLSTDAKPRPVPDGRAKTTKQELRAAGHPFFRMVTRARALLYTVLAGLGLAPAGDMAGDTLADAVAGPAPEASGGLADGLSKIDPETVSGWLPVLESLAQRLAANWYLLVLAGVAIVGVMALRQMEDYKVKRTRAGRHV